MIYISNNQEYISLLAENWFSKLHKYLTEKECYDYLKDHKTKKQTKNHIRQLQGKDRLQN